jgi:hypothetical protein
VDTHSPKGYYRTLGLAPGASLEEVKRAYRKLVKVWHPDRFAQAPHLQQHALEKMQSINHAYTRLQFIQPCLDTPPSSMPLGMWTLRQLRWLQTLPTWLVVLIAFVVLRQGVNHFVLERAPLLPHKNQLLGEGMALIPLSPTGERVRVRGVPLAWNDPHPSPLPEGEGVEAEVAAIRPNMPDMPAQPDQANSYFTVGSTQAEVLAVQGPPTLASKNVWEYGGSRVYFRYGLVSSWEMWPRSPLKVKLLPASPFEAVPAYFTIGSPRDEVLVVQGTPTRFSDRVWEYGHSRVYFEADRVARWEEWRGSPLRARYALQGED